MANPPDREHSDGEDRHEGAVAGLSREDARSEEPPQVELVPDQRPRERVLVGGANAQHDGEHRAHHPHYQHLGYGRDAPEELLRAVAAAAVYEPERHAFFFFAGVVVAPGGEAL